MNTDELTTSGPAARAGSRVDVLGVTKAFGSVRALDDVSLSVEPGQVVCLLGPSGSGKSTLLRCVNRLETPDAGMVFVDGNPIGFRRIARGFLELSGRAQARQRSAIGMVFQHFNLFQHKTVLQNVAEGPVVVRGTAPEEARAEAMTLLARVGLADKAADYPATLSGGQQQRVAIARSLAMRPSVMLFDEPTSALDPELVDEVLQVMRELAHGGMTMIVVTHEIGFAEQVADVAVYMEAGRVVETGPAATVIRSASDPRTRKFMSYVR